ELHGPVLTLSLGRRVLRADGPERSAAGGLQEGENVGEGCTAGARGHGVVEGHLVHDPRVAAQVVDNGVVDVRSGVDLRHLQGDSHRVSLVSVMPADRRGEPRGAFGGAAGWGARHLTPGPGWRGRLFRCWLC